MSVKTKIITVKKKTKAGSDFHIEVEEIETLSTTKQYSKEQIIARIAQIDIEKAELLKLISDSDKLPVSLTP